MIELNIIKDSWQLSDRNENAKNWNDLSDSSKIYYDRLMSVYAAMIDRMDQNIGKLISYLKQTTDYDNTIILFLSDNGGCHEILHRGRTGALTGTPDSFDSYEYSWANVSNTPFKWFKHWSHEGAISTPFIAWYPKMIKAGKMNKQTAHIIDIMPTLCELSGAKYPEIYNGNRIIPEEGISLVPLFKGENFQNHETLFWEHEGNRAVRKGDMKLVSRFDYKNNKELPWELYNLSTDRTEIHNLVNENTKLVKELIQLYDEWSKRVNIIPHKELKEIRKNRKL